MAQRWKGMLRLPADKSGRDFRVMASLACGPSGALQIPANNAMFFMGDRVTGSGNAIVERLSQPEHIAAAVLPKLGHGTNLWIVEASHYVGPFARYRSLLPSLTATGEPTGYDPQGLPAARACVSLLRDCLQQVSAARKNETEVAAQDGVAVPGAGKEYPEKSSPFRPFLGPTHERPRTVLLGFSKGGVVLNQLLAEIVHCEESLHLKRDGGDEGGGKAGGMLLPDTAEAFLGSVEAVHYLDVGLNCRGAYQTDPAVLEGLARVAGSRGGLSIGFHGTPRQWQDRNRRWIGQEKTQCVGALREASRKYGGGKLRVTERLYYDSMPPDMQMHFEILDAVVFD